MVQFVTVLIGSKRMMMMFDFMLAGAQMMLLTYVSVAFGSDVIMFEYGFDATRMMILLYVDVFICFELRWFKWGFDAAVFSFVFLL